MIVNNIFCSFYSMLLLRNGILEVYYEIFQGFKNSPKTQLLIPYAPHIIIKEWNVELQERTSKFRKQANAIAEWDRRILQNRDVLLKLEAKVAKVVDTQSNLERHRS
uniref:Putative nucleoporin, NSP1-like, Nucleoporin NSP1/NUP62 n=1 Tax=Helianthus annuus TaxID=4232 RepID=A0A251T0J9_HELAN